MRRERILLIPMVLVLVAAASPAHAAQLDPRTAPEVTGAEVADPARSCQRDVARRNGQVAAVGRVCTFLYTLPASATRSHVVVWQQVKVKASKGFCVTRVASDITRGPGGGRFDQVLPDTRMRARRTRIVQPTLAANGGGTMPEGPTFNQSYLLQPEEITPTLRTRADGERFRARWTGSTRRPVAVVSAAELSWFTEEESLGLASGATYRIKRQRTC